jgi:death-on-curing protein
MTSHIRFLTMAEVLMIYADQMRRYGGDYGIRDPGLLSSALAMPESRFNGTYLHSTIIEMAAAYAFHICQNHPFIDGNKRSALATALVFLSINNIEIEDPQEKLYEGMMAVASGDWKKQQLCALFEELAQ